MNSQDSDQPLSDLPGAAAPTDHEAPPKPRRKRSVAAEATPPVADAAAAAAAAPDAEVPAKPKRTRRKPVDAAAESAQPAEPAPAESVPQAPVDMAESVEAVAAPRPRRRAAAQPAPEAPVVAVETALPAAAPAEAPLGAASVVDAPAATPVASAAASDATDTAPADAASAPVAGGRTDDDAGEGEGARRRGRNRRRGRRGGADRAAREDGAAPDEAQVITVTAGDDDEDEPAAAAAPTPRAAPLDAGETFAAVLSGDYDAEPAELPAAEPERRVLAAEPDAPKLHKVLAQAGIGSRRDMEELIAEGQVMVNGQVAHTGQRISFGDRISVAGKQIKVRIAPPPPRIIAYHKPVGEVVTHDDPQHRPTVFRRLPRLPHGKWQSVGRLDINTEGLLLFTNSGELANQLMHPRFGVEREYAVRVLGTLDAEAKQRLLDGVDIEGQRASFKSIEDGGGEGVNHWYRVVITEGRNREVRKLFDKVGLGVSRLIRIRYGCVVLPRGLKRGVFVDLNEAEVREVRRLAGNPRDQQPPQGGGQRPPRPEGGAPREGQGGQRQNDKRRGGPPQQRAERDRPERGPRQGDRRDRAPDRPPVDRDADVEHENFAAIPNPLMQTFDKRAIKEARAPRREIAEDGPIPNPLEQTYDKRFVQKGGKGFGIGGGRKGGGGGGGGGGGQPDPMKTSLGYIGADAFVRKFQGNSGGGGGGGGGGRRGGGGGGGRRGGGR
jgi:23S rRNA pseudouridine2605 synthase